MTDRKRLSSPQPKPTVGAMGLSRQPEWSQRSPTPTTMVASSSFSRRMRSLPNCAAGASNELRNRVVRRLWLTASCALCGIGVQPASSCHPWGWHLFGTSMLLTERRSVGGHRSDASTKQAASVNDFENFSQKRALRNSVRSGEGGDSRHVKPSPMSAQCSYQN